MIKRFDGGFVSAVAVTPNDSTPLAVTSRGVYVGTGGNLKVTMADGGTPLTFTGVPTGTLLEISVSLIWATGTTASNIVSLR